MRALSIRSQLEKVSQLKGDLDQRKVANKKFMVSAIWDKKMDFFFISSIKLRISNPSDGTFLPTIVYPIFSFAIESCLGPSLPLFCKLGPRKSGPGKLGHG